MTAKRKTVKRFLSVLLCLALIITYIPMSIAGRRAQADISSESIVTDLGTADTWETMMGTDADGNRYAGRVWADKSVYTDGQTVMLNNKGTADSKFTASLEKDEAFQVVFSVLGSSMTTTTTSSSAGSDGSGGFNPITDTTTVDGGTGVNSTPLIYVDTIGKYMEVKEVQAVTLFGASYTVTKNEDGTYTVQTGVGTNPTTNENFNTSEDIKITVTEENGVQKLEIRIAQEVLPIILEQVHSNNIGDVSSATINEMTYGPLRVYYTIGIDADILLPNGEIDVTKIDKNYPYFKGDEITLYSNAFGIMNPTDENGNVNQGDAHVGFKPSNENRYYYHQSNQGIFTKITNASDGSTVTIPENQEYGIRYEKGKYNFTYLTYDDYKSLKDTDTVYTYVTYYHPTPSETDAANAAEEVTYIVYTDWGYLKESVGFYDFNAGKYINYDESNGYTTADKGYVISKDKIDATIEAYLKANPNANITAVLGVGSLRTSRLHNMTVEKQENSTSTASLRYAPEYTYETAIEHHDNDVVVWLGNNGRLTTKISTGIALTKSVTEAIGSEEDTYALTVTVPDDVDAAPIVKNAYGNDVTNEISTYSKNVLTVNLKAGETVYVSGIPSGTECIIGENVPQNALYYIQSKTDKVVVPTIGDVLNGKAEQFVNAIVTNAPHKFGNLYITKEMESDHNIPASVLEEEFALEVNGGAALAGKTFSVLGAIGVDSVTFDNSGKAKFVIKARQTIEILGIPQDAVVTVTEILTESQSKIFNTKYRTRNHTGEDADNDNKVTIPAGANATAVITNTYTPLPTSVDLDVEITKNFIVDDAVALSGGIFNFKVQQWKDSQWSDISLGSVKYEQNERGTKKTVIENVLGGIEYTTTGTWAYQVLEVKGNINNLTYDRTLYTFTVTVTDNDGALVAKVTDLNNALIEDGVYEVEFNNTYHTAPVSIDIEKTVTNLSGDPEISTAGFAFTARQTDENWNMLTSGSPLTVYSDAAGEARVAAYYKQAGTYYYILREARPYGSEEVTTGEYKGMFLYNGWYYDATEYRIKLDITDDGSGNLKANITLNGDNLNTDSAKVAFANVYDPADAVINVNLAVKKSLIGKNLEANAFTFYLCNNGEAESVLNGSKAPLLTGKNDAEGNVIFNNDGKLTFNSFGKYEFDIVEAIPDGAVYNAATEKYVLNGMSYDATIYDMVVEVENNRRTGKLKASYYFEDSTTETVTFNNWYNVTPAEYEIGGTVLLTGRAMQADEFALELYEDGVLLETVSNKADGSFAFNTINYAEAGVHTYEIRQKKGNTSGVTYTGAQCPVTINVTVWDEGGILKASADKQNSDIKFENSYKPAPATVNFKVVKNVVGNAEGEVAFTFKLYKTDRNFDVNSQSAEVLVTEQSTAGEFVLETIEYSETGVYFYTVLEDAGVNPVKNMVYDSTQHNYRVQVRDNNQGALVVSVDDMLTGNAINSAFLTNVNAVASFTNATSDEVAKVQVYLGGDTSKPIDGEKVNAGDVLTYFITYSNFTGNDVVVTINDNIPENTSYVDGSASHDATYNNGCLEWILSVEKGGVVTVSFEVMVKETNLNTTNTVVVNDSENIFTINNIINNTNEGENVDTPPSSAPDNTPSGSTSTSQSAGSANTYDNSNIYLWFTLMFVSGSIVLLVAFISKKRKTI